MTAKRFGPKTGRQCTALLPACYGRAERGVRACTCPTAAEMREMEAEAAEAARWRKAATEAGMRRLAEIEARRGQPF